MKLIQIWNAQAAWVALSKLAKAPAVSFKLMFYYIEFQKVFAVIEQERIIYLKEFGTESESGNISIEPGTAAYQKFTFKFEAYLMADHDMLPIEMDMQEMVDSIIQGDDDSKSNAVSEAELLTLLPFFKDTAEQFAVKKDDPPAKDDPKAEPIKPAAH